MSHLWLLPNFGAEDGNNWPNHLAQPFLQQIARLWSTILSPQDPSRIKWCDERCPELRAWNARSQSLYQPHRPSTTPPFLARAMAPIDRPILVPWMATQESHAISQTAGLHELIGPADVAWRLHSKQFAYLFAKRNRLLYEPFARWSTDLDTSALAAFADQPSGLADLVSSWPSACRDRLTLKPFHSTSGRGRLALRPDFLTQPQLVGGLKRLAQTGALLEPWVNRTTDFSVHYWIYPDLPPQHLGTLRQHLSYSGSFFGHSGVIDQAGRVTTGTTWDQELVAQTKGLADHVQAEGYVGPIGIDAFTYRWSSDDGTQKRTSANESDAEMLRPIVEMNVRFTMGTLTLGLLDLALQANPQLSLPCKFTLPYLAERSLMGDAECANHPHLDKDWVRYRCLNDDGPTVWLKPGINLN